MAASKLFVASIVAFVPCIATVLWLVHAVRDAAPDRCNTLLDEYFVLRPSQIFRHLDCMGPAGRHAHLQFYMMDFALYPVVYGTMFGGMIQRLWPQMPVLALLPKGAAFFDILENAMVVTMLRAFPARHEGLEMALSACTGIKWLSAVLGVASIIVALVATALGTSTSTQLTKKTA